MFRIALHSLGCRTNQVESEAIRCELERGGEAVCFVPWSEPADAHVLNSCTVTSRADRQSRQWIHRAHRTSPGSGIVVAGCYAESDAAVLAAIPGVVAVLGPGHRQEVASHVRAVLDGDRGETVVLTGDLDGERKMAGHRVERFPTRTRAPVKVQEGCDRRCTYCIVPSVRGRSRSLGEEDTVADVRRLAAAGHPEIVIAGTHIGRWGRDLRPRRHLVDLLERLIAAAPGVRFRLSSLDPHEVTSGLLDLLGGDPDLCRHLHLTLQHLDPRILEAMGRRPPSGGLPARVEDIARRVPGIGLGADVIAGFPGEDRGTFDRLAESLATMPLSYLHVFGYSVRPGTPAASLPDPVPADERRQRVAILREIAAGTLAPRFADSLLGREVDVVVERRGAAIVGTSSEFVSVELSGDAPRVGERVTARVVEAVDGTLRAEVVRTAADRRARTGTESAEPDATMPVMGRNDPRERLAARIGYTFADSSLLETALTHRSFANEQRGTPIADNERIEFLGDAVLDFHISEQLVRRMPGWSEGDLSQARASLVNEQALAALARDLELGPLLRLGRGEEKTGGRGKDSLLADALEALIGALLLDGGIGSCQRVLDRMFGPAIEGLDRRPVAATDPKTMLQEWLAARSLSPPHYRILGEKGPPHRRTFTVGVVRDEDVLAVGSGSSKKVAERRAADAALARLQRAEPIR